MNPIPYFLCFAAGMAVNAIYNQRQKVAEKKAYNKGYKQAQKEEAIRIESRNKTDKLDMVYELPTAYNLEPETETKRNIKTVDESFMECLQANGRAVVKFGGASNE
jgi:hypothetical protein